MIVVYWRRWSKWLLLGTVVMLLWLLWPTIHCSVTHLEKASFGEIANTTEEQEGFFSKWLTSTKRCYQITPLLGQEAWKTYLFLSLAGATVITRVLARFTTGKHGIDG